jgi:hypothetical protein
MNERIKELAKQAGMWRQHYDIGEESPSNLEEFVELIVLDCLDIVDREVPGMIGVHTMKVISEHFGVE